jgi:uncharacterized protein (TIGR01244 family)
MIGAHTCGSTSNTSRQSLIFSFGDFLHEPHAFYRRHHAIHALAQVAVAAAEAAGIDFVFNPVTGGAMTLQNVEEQAEAIAGSDGPVVAYCGSGTRSAIAWALAMAGAVDTDAILNAAADAGYPLDHMRGQIDAFAAATGRDV